MNYNEDYYLTDLVGAIMSTYNLKTEIYKVGLARKLKKNFSVGVNLDYKNWHPEQSNGKSILGDNWCSEEIHVQEQ